MDRSEVSTMDQVQTNAQLMPGWYSDPSGVGQLRYFDGTGWTAHVNGLVPAPPAPRLPQR